MIQIQDDNFNQSAAAPSLNQNQTQSPTSSPSINQNASNPSDKSSEIDRLLAELDTLSKNLDDNPSVAKPIVEEPVISPKLADDQKPTDSPKPAEEKFDFDAFLSDLEKKIDQQNNNDTNTSLDLVQDSSTSPTPDNFRKNRSFAEPQFAKPQVEDEKLDQPVVNPVTNYAPQPEASIKPENDSEELKAQNIFEMLGLMNIRDEEKNQFLDDLESMIWDDFVAHDLELLLTSEEYAGAREILDKKDQDEAQRKENLIAYLEKLVPDLDEVLYDKALELKSEMMGERLVKMKDSTDLTILAKIKEAEALISQNRWKSAVSLLNQLS